MNERINELAAAAGGHEVAPYDFLFRQQDMQKFVELIVQECVEQVGRNYVGAIGTYAGVHNSAILKCKKSIQEHFKIDS